MKVLLFTHSQDIDGITCAFLAGLTFEDLKSVPTKTFDITSNVKKYIDSKEIYEYDQVYVTDLCIKEPVLTEIDNNPILREKILVIDHHKTEIDEGNDKYDFVNIKVLENGKKVSGTSLFYRYLLDNNYLKETSFLNELTDNVRQYDVWEWKENNNLNARGLHILFEELGYERYLKLLQEKVSKQQKFSFNDYEEKIIKAFLSQEEKDIKRILENLKIIDLAIDSKTYKIGFTKCQYRYRNDLNEYIIEHGNKYDIDSLGVIMTDTDTVSYRQVRDLDVSIIAKYFGGKGHVTASSNPQSNEKFHQLLKKLNF